LPFVCGEVEWESFVLVPLASALNGFSAYVVDCNSRIRQIKNEKNGVLVFS
jgi:hypothetical protein